MIVALCACSDRKPVKPPPASEPPRPVAPTPVAGSGSGAAITGSGSASTAPSDGDRWTAAWKRASEVTPAGAPRNNDWPCSAKADNGLEYTYTYGGPAKCVTPPEPWFVGCPIALKKGSQYMLPEEQFFYYNADGELIAIREPGKTELRTRISYEHGKPAVSETDSDGNGIPDSRTRWTYTGDKVVTEDDFAGNGKYEQTGESTFKNGKFVADKSKMATGKYTWSGNRLMTQEALSGGQHIATLRFNYDCK